MKNLMFKRAALLLSALFLILFSTGTALCDNNVRAAYEKYLKSYNDFKGAIDQNLDADSIKLYAERYKSDLDNYKKLAGGEKSEADGSKAAASSGRISGESGMADGAEGAPEAVRESETHFEKAIIDLHSGDKTKIEKAVEVFKNTIAVSKNPVEVNRARYELANAYMTTNDFADAEKLYKSLIVSKDATGANASKALETLNYLKTKTGLAASTQNARTAALEKKAAYDNISWRSPFKKVSAKISQLTSAFKYRKSLATLREQAKDGDAGFIGVTKSLLTDLFKNRDKIDVNDKNENALFTNDVVWKKRQRIAALINKNNGIYKVCNVRWGFTGTETGDEDKILPKWRTVTVDTNGVTEAYFVMKPFAPEWIAGHSFFMFEFDKEHPVVTEYGEKSYGFIVSLEAHLKEGQSYSFTGSFGVVYLMLSKEDYIQICAVNKSRLIPYRMKLSNEQKKSLLTCAIEEALKERGMERYELFENNCTNVLFEMLNTVIPKEQRFREWIVKNILYNKTLALPKTAPKILKKHGLVAEVMPTILPEAKNAADPAGKPLEGEELAAAKRSLETIMRKADRVKTEVLAAIDNGRLDKTEIKRIFYNEESDTVFALNIPGAVPDEGAKSAFEIDGREFVKNMAATKSKEGLEKYVGGLFDAYIRALSNRMLVHGPDISKYLTEGLENIENAVK